MIDQHVAARVAEDRRADGERLERDQREALVGRRAHDDRRRFQRLQAFLFGQHAGEIDERLLRQRHQLQPHEDQRRVTTGGDVGAEVFDQLFAALARIDASAVQRERSVNAMAALEARPPRRNVRRKAAAFAAGLSSFSHWPACPRPGPARLIRAVRRLWGTRDVAADRRRIPSFPR